MSPESDRRSTDINPRDFGKMEAELAAMKLAVAENSADLKAIRAALQEARGGWKVALAGAGFAGAIASWIVQYVPVFPFR